MHEAKNIANVLVSKGLAACVNMHPITSVYKWKGNVEEEGEVELSIKTTSEMLENVKRLLSPCTVTNFLPCYGGPWMEKISMLSGSLNV